MSPQDRAERDLPEEPVWQLSVENDPSWVGSEAFVASFLSWVDAVEALHRVAEQMEQVDDRSTAGTTPADVADMLSVRRHTP